MNDGMIMPRRQHAKSILSLEKALIKLIAMYKGNKTRRSLHNQRLQHARLKNVLHNKVPDKNMLNVMFPSGKLKSDIRSSKKPPSSKKSESIEINLES